MFSSERLMKQINFIVEIDKLKSVLRQTTIMDASRKENDAEHSWHLAMMAILLSEYANEEVEVAKVMKKVLIHDLVEIDAGDTFAFDFVGHEDKAEREEKAARRIFSLLPEDQYKEVYDLWREFEDGDTPEARFARVLDRLQPLLHNYHTEGGTWQIHNIKRPLVEKRFECVKEGSEVLAALVAEIVEDSVKKGYLSC